MGPVRGRGRTATGWLALDVTFCGLFVGGLGLVKDLLPVVLVKELLTIEVRCPERFPSARRHVVGLCSVPI